MSGAPNGIERVRRAIAREGGYAWCERHSTYRHWGPTNCADQHADEVCLCRFTEEGWVNTLCPRHRGDDER